MSQEIPNTGTQLTGNCFYTKDIGLAAACMADDLIPRLTLADISVLVDGDHRFTQFNFPDNPAVAKTFAEWKDCVEGKQTSTPVARIYRAFHYWNQFVNIIKDERLTPRPDTIPQGMTWTTNTKLPATALALLNGPLYPYPRLTRMVYRNGRDCGFMVRQGEVTEAYADPERYIELNPDSDLSYIIAGLYHRDHLRDIVKTVPARHVFRDGTDIHIIPEPQPKTSKEIPCLTKK